jgi:hypothetical protein
MKFVLTFKTPDAVEDALAECSDSERQTAERLTDKFFKYGEYADIEIDTEAGTATVLEAD